ncbi:hypothetical protein EAH79_01500 [Sphingomonas koreensis]|nr:hypothetical protein EAH79_01500 [Sphingomonas koreensis]
MDKAQDDNLAPAQPTISAIDHSRGFMSRGFMPVKVIAFVTVTLPALTRPIRERWIRVAVS